MDTQAAMKDYIERNSVTANTPEGVIAQVKKIGGFDIGRLVGGQELPREKGHAQTLPEEQLTLAMKAVGYSLTESDNPNPVFTSGHDNRTFKSWGEVEHFLNSTIFPDLMDYEKDRIMDMDDFDLAFECRDLYEPEPEKNAMYDIEYVEDGRYNVTEFTCSSVKSAQHELKGLWDAFCQENDLDPSCIQSIRSVGEDKELEAYEREDFDRGYAVLNDSREMIFTADMPAPNTVDLFDPDTNELVLHTVLDRDYNPEGAINHAIDRYNDRGDEAPIEYGRVITMNDYLSSGKGASRINPEITKVCKELFDQMKEYEDNGWGRASARIDNLLNSMGIQFPLKEGGPMYITMPDGNSTILTNDNPYAENLLSIAEMTRPMIEEALKADKREMEAEREEPDMEEPEQEHDDWGMDR